VHLGASSGFFPSVGKDFGFGFSGFSSVTTFGLFGCFGLLSLSVIRLPTFLAAFAVAGSVLACLAGVDSLFLLSVFLGGDLLDAVVQFWSSSVVISGVPVNFSPSSRGRQVGVLDCSRARVVGSGRGVGAVGVVGSVGSD